MNKLKLIILALALLISASANATLLRQGNNQITAVERAEFKYLHNNFVIFNEEIQGNYIPFNNKLTGRTEVIFYLNGLYYRIKKTQRTKFTANKGYRKYIYDTLPPVFKEFLLMNCDNGLTSCTLPVVEPSVVQKEVVKKVVVHKKSISVKSRNINIIAAIMLYYLIDDGGGGVDNPYFNVGSNHSRGNDNFWVKLTWKFDSPIGTKEF